MREKILNLLRNKKINIDGQLVPIETPEELTTALISTLIESLPEEENENDENLDEIESACLKGFNVCRSEVINLLRGN